MKRIVMAALAAVPLFAAASARAQVADTTRQDTVLARPFVEGGVYDKPYLGRLLGRTAIGGYAEAHARWVQADGVRDELGFELRRWNLFTATQVNDFVRIAAELEIEELAEEITLEFAAIDITIHPFVALRAGALLAPIGRFNLAHDSPLNEFTDRPLVSTEIVGTALTEAGIGLLGQRSIGAGRFTYEVYAVNGFNDGVLTSSPDGTRIPAGKGSATDENGSPALVGRVSWSPRLGYEVGLSAHRGAYNVFQLDGEAVDRRRDIGISALDFEAALAGVELSGEAVVARVDLPPGLRGVYAARQAGLYAQAVRRFGRGWVAAMPESLFETGIRYDVVDFDTDLHGDSVERITTGINFRPSEDVAIKLDFVRGRTRDRFNNRGDDAGLLFSVASYF
ncbi:MAG: hypothetical protein WD054_00840 [Gemmatimonadota bacterium]